MKRWPKILLILGGVIGGLALLVGGVRTFASGSGDGDEDQVKVVDRGKVKIVRPDGDGKSHAKVYVIDDGEQRAFLGVRLEGDSETDGAVVEEVIEDSPADRAGVQSGDVIVGIAGDEVGSPRVLVGKIHEAKPGDRVQLELMRDGDRRRLTVELGEREGHEVIEGEAMQRHMAELERLGELPGLRGHGLFMRHGRPKLGVQLVDATPELREHMGGSSDSGVLVSKVLPGTAADRAGVRVGDLIVAVDDQEIEGVGDLVEALEEKSGETITIRVIRDRRTMTLEADIPEDESEEQESRGPRARWESEEAAQAREMARLEARAHADHAAGAGQVHREAIHAAREGRAAARDAAREARHAAADAAREAHRAIAASRETIRQAVVESQRALAEVTRVGQGSEIYAY